MSGRHNRSGDALSADSVNHSDLLGGRYIKVREIGSGGSGVVYEALHHLTRERVAIKVIRLKMLGDHQRVVARFMREAKLSHQIQHSGVVRVTDAWIDEQERCCLVMELLSGMSLREAIQNGKTPRYQAVRWIIESLEPLEAAHRAGIIHRDLKPENLYVHLPPVLESDTLITSQPLFFDEERGELRPLSERGSSSTTGDYSGSSRLNFNLADIDSDLNRDEDMTKLDILENSHLTQVKLLDFGLSRTSFSPSVTQTGHFVGTPWYMSPEQIFTPKKCQHTTDLWSIGVMLFEILTDDVPFTGESMPELCLAVRDHAIPSLAELKPELPSELVQCIEQCLERDPGRRIQSAAQIKYQLEQVFDQFMRTSIANECVESSLSLSSSPVPTPDPTPDPMLVSGQQRDPADVSRFNAREIRDERDERDVIGAEGTEPDITPVRDVQVDTSPSLSSSPSSSPLEVEIAPDQRETIRINSLQVKEEVEVNHALTPHRLGANLPMTEELTSDAILRALEIAEGDSDSKAEGEDANGGAPELTDLEGLDLDNWDLESFKLDEPSEPSSGGGRERHITIRQSVNPLHHKIPSPPIQPKLPVAMSSHHELPLNEQITPPVADPLPHQINTQSHPIPQRTKKSPWLLWLVGMFVIGIIMGLAIRYWRLL